MILPLGDDNPTRRPPVVTYGLIALNVLVFFLGNPPGGSEAFGTFITTWGFHASEPVSVQLVTAMFLHANFLHLAGNVWTLHIFGDNVEDKLGRGRYLLLYLLGGVSASWAYTLVGDLTAAPALDTLHGPALASLPPEPPLVGASGAIAAVMGMYLVLFPEARVRLLVWFLILIQFVSIRAKWFIGLLIAFDVWRTLEAMGPAHGTVATSAHVGGGVFGIAVGLALKRRIGGGAHGDAWDVHTGFARTEVTRRHGRRAYDRPISVVPPVEPPEPDLMAREHSIVELVRADRAEEAASLYTAYEALAREKPLPADVQIEIAHEFYRQALPREALHAYERYLVTHPGGADAAEAKFRAGVLFARSFNRRKEAVRLLREAADEHPDARVAGFARQELARLGIQP